jgi:hypothetical protein
MDTQSLPRYCGLPDSPKGWGEPDGHGKRPSMRLRDYVVLSLILMIVFPISPSLVVRFLACRWDAEILQTVRDRQMEMEIRRSSH